MTVITFKCCRISTTCNLFLRKSDVTLNLREKSLLETESFYKVLRTFHMWIDQTLIYIFITNFTSTFHGISVQFLESKHSKQRLPFNRQFKVGTIIPKCLAAGSVISINCQCCKMFFESLCFSMIIVNLANIRLLKEQTQNQPVIRYF